MNTAYAAQTFGGSPAGVDLSQMFIAPTYARKLGSHHAIGSTGIVAYPGGGLTVALPEQHEG